jgi:hypothetical protein
MTDVTVEPTALRYKFRSNVTARYFEYLAQEVILANGLRLTAELEIWRRNGKIVKMYLVVEYVREEYLVADECQDDEGLSGGWWNKGEE